ncbi:DUF268 domain-containing protein [Bacteroidota bacterium]
MNHYVKHIGKMMITMGFNPLTTFNFIKGFPGYIKDYFRFKNKIKGEKNFPFALPLPQLNDKYDKSGVMSGHYFHQDLLVAGKIFQNNPEKHIDIGSRVDGFVAHVASFREIEVFDIRKHIGSIKNIIFRQADLMELPEELVDYSDSVSSLHAIEHFGLGRYGDKINPDGHLLALRNIYKILKPGGSFYLSVPIGKQRIEFNGHRVFGLSYLMEIIKPDYEIIEFSFVDDAGDLHEKVSLINEVITKNCNCIYGCGIFELLKK